MGWGMTVKETIPLRLTPNTLAMLDFQGPNGLFLNMASTLLQSLRIWQGNVIALCQAYSWNYFEGIDAGCEFKLD